MNKYGNMLKIDGMDLTGKYGIPIIKKETIKIPAARDVTSWNLRNRKGIEGIHFFIDDYRFEYLWDHPAKYIDSLLSMEFVCSPDFSLYSNYPKAYQIWNVFRSRFIGRYLQMNGVHVVPTVSWSDEQSFEFCFAGIEVGSVVAVSSVGCMKSKSTKKAFLNGYQKMIEILNPSKIIFYGIIPEEISQKNIILNLAPFYKKLEGAI